MEWKKHRLRDLALSIQTGPFGSQLHQSDYSEYGIPVIMPKDMINGKIVTNDIARVSDIHVQRLKRHKVSSGDIIYSRRGDVGRCSLITEREEGWLCGTGCLKVALDKTKCVPSFIAFILQRKDSIGWVENHAVGATMPNLNTGILSNLPLIIPTVEEQRRIASILSAYDNLIENNNKRIRLLEQMAENLYKEWFVRFRFPGHEKAEFENGLPKGWKIIKLGEFITFERGVGYGSKDIADGENVLLSMNNIRPYGGFIRDYSRPYSGKYKEFQKVKKGDLIMSITDMTQDRRIIGYTGIVPPGKDNRIICTHLMKLSSQEYHSYFLDGLFNYSNLSRVIAERATGANVLGLTADILKGVKTLLPPKQLQSLYVSKVIPIIEECFSLQDANDNLSRQRDLLLPRLMSGKLEVKV